LPTRTWIAVMTRMMTNSTQAIAEAKPILKNWKACWKR
jgi:hypothetical protein